VIKSVC